MKYGLARRLFQPYLKQVKMYLREEGKTAVAFCDIAPCSPVEVEWHFRGVCCLYYQGDDGCSTDL
jgi:hypothetical protein